MNYKFHTDFRLLNCISLSRINKQMLIVFRNQVLKILARSLFSKRYVSNHEIAFRCRCIFPYSENVEKKKIILSHLMEKKAFPRVSSSLSLIRFGRNKKEWKNIQCLVKRKTLEGMKYHHYLILRIALII